MQLLSPTSITTAVTNLVAAPVILNGAPRNLTCQATFTETTGGTTVDAYLDTSIDGGVSWIAIANFHFTTSSGRKVANFSATTPEATPLDATAVPASNTGVDGILGSMFRARWTTTGTYAAGATLRMDIQSIDIAGNPS